jgi:hypothetical protein
MAAREPTKRLPAQIGAVLAIWCAATAAALAVAAETKIGPIVLRISQRHGVHAGDLVAAAVASAASAVVTWRLVVRWQAAARAGNR